MGNLAQIQCFHSSYAHQVFIDFFFTIHNLKFKHNFQSINWIDHCSLQKKIAQLSQHILRDPGFHYTSSCTISSILFSFLCTSSQKTKSCFIVSIFSLFFSFKTAGVLNVIHYYELCKVEQGHMYKNLPKPHLTILLALSG